MATITIPQLNTVTVPTGNDLIEVVQPDSGSASGYATGKESLSQVANLIANGTQFSGLTTTNQTLVGSINEVKEISADNLAEAYDGTATYNEGDYCTYDGVLYKCNTDNTTGTWDVQYWDATTVFQCVYDGKELIADAVTDKGVPTSASDTFQDMADNIAQISGGGVKVIPLNVWVNEGDQTYTKTVTDGYYLMGTLRANNQTGTITISGTYTVLYNKYGQQIVKIEGTATITFTLTADTSYPNAHVFAYICQIEGATTFTDYYGQSTYDSGSVYDFSNLGNGKYIVLATGTSIYTGTSTAYVTYPYNPDSGRIAELGDVMQYYNQYGFKALTIIVREAPSQSHFGAKIYAYGQYGGSGNIQIIEVS